MSKKYNVVYKGNRTSITLNAMLSRLVLKTGKTIQDIVDVMDTEYEQDVDTGRCTLSYAVTTECVLHVAFTDQPMK